jgi:hypothetical protein
MKFPGLELQPEGKVFNVKLPEFFNTDGSTYVPGTVRSIAEFELRKIIYDPNVDKFLFSYHQTPDRVPKFEDANSITGKDYEIVKNFINYHRLHNVLSDLTDEWLWIRINRKHVPVWNDLIFELQKEIELTNQDCKYLNINLKRSDLLKKSSDLGLI